MSLHILDRDLDSKVSSSNRYVERHKIKSNHVIKLQTKIYILSILPSNISFHFIKQSKLGEILFFTCKKEVDLKRGFNIVVLVFI